MGTDVYSHKGQTDTNPDTLFHRLDIPGKRILYPHEGLSDNKTDLLVDLFFEFELHGMAYLQNGICI